MQANAIDTSPGVRAPSTRPMTVLLVEDDPSVREFVAEVLTRCGYSVLKARHSTEALHFQHEFEGSIHLLLTDLCMDPHLNGRELAGLIRHVRPGIPVLYISGYVDDREMIRELETGQARFLSKPFTTAALMESVRLAIDVAVEPGESS